MSPSRGSSEQKWQNSVIFDGVIAVLSANIFDIPIVLHCNVMFYYIFQVLLTGIAATQNAKTIHDLLQEWGVPEEITIITETSAVTSIENHKHGRRDAYPEWLPGPQVKHPFLYLNFNTGKWIRGY